MIGKCNTGGENVKAEVTAQTPLIEQILEGLVGKAQGANATADKILEGYSAYVGQELLHGTAKDVAALFGCTKYAVDKFTPATKIADTLTQISHSLGEIPLLTFIYTEDDIKGSSSTDCPGKYYVGLSNPTNSANSIFLVALPCDTTGELKTPRNYTSNCSAYDTYIRIYLSVHAHIPAGVEYTLITMA